MINKISFTNRLVIIILDIIALVMSFLPLIKLDVDLLGMQETVSLNALAIVTGVKIQWFTFLESQYEFLFFLIAPFVILIVSTMKKIKDDTSLFIILILSIGEVIFWIGMLAMLFYVTANNQYKLSDNIKVTITLWYSIYLICLLFIIIICMKLKRHETSLDDLFSF